MRRITKVVCIALTCLLLIVGVSTAQNGVETSDLCQTLTLEQDIPRVPQWIDAQTVLFRISDNTGINRLVSPRSIWYTYKTVTNTLEREVNNPLVAQLPGSRLATVPGLNREEDDIYRNVFISPDQSALVYPNGETYAYYNFNSGMSTDLGIETIEVEMETLWTQDRTAFVLQDEAKANFTTVPPYLVEINDSGSLLRVTPIAELSVFDTFTFPYPSFSFPVLSISPDGRYLLVEAQLVLTQEGVFPTWLVDLQNREYEALEFSLLTKRGTVWTGLDTFRAITYDGVIDFDVPSRNFETVTSAERIGLSDIGHIIVSPDGQYLIGRPKDLTPRNVVIVCRLDD